MQHLILISLRSPTYGGRLERRGRTFGRAKAHIPTKLRDVENNGKPEPTAEELALLTQLGQLKRLVNSGLTPIHPAKKEASNWSVVIRARAD